MTKRSTNFTPRRPKPGLLDTVALALSEVKAQRDKLAVEHAEMLALAKNLCHVMRHCTYADHPTMAAARDNALATIARHAGEVPPTWPTCDKCGGVLPMHRGPCPTLSECEQERIRQQEKAAT